MKYLVVNLYDIINSLMTAEQTETDTLSESAMFETKEEAEQFKSLLSKKEGFSKNCFFVDTVENQKHMA